MWSANYPRPKGHEKSPPHAQQKKCLSGRTLCILLKTIRLEMMGDHLNSLGIQRAFFAASIIECAGISLMFLLHFL
jgi:hypothetical protein